MYVLLLPRYTFKRNLHIYDEPIAICINNLINRLVLRRIVKVWSLAHSQGNYAFLLEQDLRYISANETINNVVIHALGEVQVSVSS